MPVFGEYSRYYNLLYKDKDYEGEAAYIHGLIQRNRPGAASVLDLGCGTGRHDLLLAEKGYAVTGVDMSEEMLAVANSCLPAFDERSVPVRFVQGDVRTVRLGQKFDAVISLFHVMSYQTANVDLQNAFMTACEHLDRGGVFIFDCWFGPAVLTDRPTVRVKRLEDEETQIVRLAEPAMHPEENIVDVNYHILIRDKKDGTVRELKERHRMRYLFRPEVAFLLEQCGFALEGCGEFMTGNRAGFDTWNTVFVGRKR